MKFVLVLIFSFYCFLIFAQKNDSISITGTALNAKAGAVVKLTNGKIYYIDNLSAWPENLYNKNVTVSGILKTENFKQADQKNEKGEWSQGMIGEKQTILKAQWKNNLIQSKK